MAEYVEQIKRTESSKMTSKATKRKHVMKEVLDEFVLPEGAQQIVRVVSSCGNNLHQVVNPQGERFLVSMPTKFRRNVWIKRDDYVIVVPIEEGDKVKAEIFTILYKDQIKYIKDSNKWPEEFLAEKEKGVNGDQVDADMLPPSHSDSDEDEISDREDNDQQGGQSLLIGAGNPNRQRITVSDDGVDSGDDEEEEDSTTR